MDPLSTMINEARSPAEWAEAAALVRTRILTGQADAGLIHHLMIKGWRVLDGYHRLEVDTTPGLQRARQVSGFMTRRMIDVLDTAVGQSTV